MLIKRGIVVSHTGGTEWGAGKVIEVSDCKATIQFSDGIIRKIASSHYTVLEPADASAYLLAADADAPPKAKPAAKRVRKVKEVAA